jgi:GT2 family glycosyltransferase
MRRPGPEPLPVTVVIPAYRRPEMVERAVRSVLEQTRPPHEVIVVDDASGDDTGDRAAGLGARVITHQQNLGEGPARNTGLEAATQDWVALLDSDDEWLPPHLEALWESRDGHVLVGTAVLGTSEDPRDHHVHGWTGRHPHRLRGPADVALPDSKLVPSAVLLRRHAALQVGGFRPLPLAADLDMWLRLLEEGTGLAIPRVTVLYHVHPGQASADPRPMHKAHRAVLDAYVDRPWCTTPLRRCHDGMVAWDSARARWAGGASSVRTALLLMARLAHIRRAAGVAQLLARRFRARRITARFAPGGVPSVAILPGVNVDPAIAPGAVDFRDRSFGAALLLLLRRPTSQALVGGRIRTLLIRALGVEPVHPSRVMTDPPRSGDSQ